VVHHERAARALERLGILCYDVAKPMKDCGCQETVFTNSLVGTKTGGRPGAMANFAPNDFIVFKSTLHPFDKQESSMAQYMAIIDTIYLLQYNLVVLVDCSSF